MKCRKMKRRLMHRQVQLSALTVIVVLALIIGSIMFIPASAKDKAVTVQSVVTSAAILLGGFFAVFKLQIFRDFEPHLSISQEVSHRFIGGDYVHIVVTATLNNRSRVKAELLKGFLRVQKILPAADEEVERLYAQVFIDGEYEDLQWPILDEIRRPGIQKKLVVEPGELHQETCEFIISSEVKSVLVYTYFHNSRYSIGSQAAEGWAATTVYDIVKPSPV